MKSPINDGKECNIRKFSDGTKLGRVVDTSGCQWAGEGSQQEPHAVQQMKIQSPAPREEQRHAPAYAGVWLANKQLYR